MTITIIQDRLKSYNLQSKQEELSALKEIYQEIALAGLARSDFLVYPYPFSILIQDLPSLFASKCHALLCRKYQKGRDWFDFLWYLMKQVPMNYHLLKNALYQAGPYKGYDIAFSKKWVQNEF